MPGVQSPSVPGDGELTPSMVEDPLLEGFAGHRVQAVPFIAEAAGTQDARGMPLRQSVHSRVRDSVP